MEKLTLKDGTSAPFTLSQCGIYDAETRAKERLTAWGALSLARQTTGKSRKARRAVRKQAA